jgi:hypothetical protein
MKSASERQLCFQRYPSKGANKGILSGNVCYNEKLCIVPSIFGWCDQMFKVNKMTWGIETFFSSLTKLHYMPDPSGENNFALNTASK